MNECCRDTIASLLTSSDVAFALGITRQRVHDIARCHAIGTRLNDRLTVFTTEDVAALAGHLA